MHGPSFFSFHFLSFSISFHKLTVLTILSLYMACKMWKITDCAHLRDIELKTEITKLKKNICFESRKKDTKTSKKKTRMKWNDTKWSIWYFQKCACVNAIYFAPVVTTTYRMKNNNRSTRGLSLEMSVLVRARAQWLIMLYNSTHLSVPHG